MGAKVRVANEVQEMENDQIIGMLASHVGSAALKTLMDPKVQQCIGQGVGQIIKDLGGEDVDEELLAQWGWLNNIGNAVKSAASSVAHVASQAVGSIKNGLLKVGSYAINALKNPRVQECLKHGGFTMLNNLMSLEEIDDETMAQLIEEFDQLTEEDYIEIFTESLM